MILNIRMAHVGAALALASAGCLVAAGAAVAGSDHGKDKVGVCHRTASESNPYVYIEVPKDEANGHITGTSKQHNEKVTWKSDGTWRGTPHKAGDLKLDYYASNKSECEDTKATTPPPSSTSTSPTTVPTTTGTTTTTSASSTTTTTTAPTTSTTTSTQPSTTTSSTTSTTTSSSSTTTTTGTTSPTTSHSATETPVRTTTGTTAHPTDSRPPATRNAPRTTTPTPAVPEELAYTGFSTWVAVVIALLLVAAAALVYWLRNRSERTH